LTQYFFGWRGPPSLPHIACWISFLGIKKLGCGIGHPALIAPRSRMGRAVHPPPIHAFIKKSVG